MSSTIIGIIGGTGSMGRWFERFFAGAGHNVLISGRKTKISFRDIAEKCDVVVLSVPLDAAISLSREIGPLMSQDQLLMDLCSLKENIMESMLSYTSAQVVGTHPLFGPFTNSMKGQNILICPGRGTDRLNWLEEVFRAEEAVVTRMDPVAHDKHMAVVQGLTHFLTICMGRTLQKMNMAPDEAMFYSTPVFRINVDLIGRLFSQDTELYADLIGKNRHVKEALETFMAAMEEGKGSLLSGQDGDKNTYLGNIRGFLGDFCRHGLNESNKIINDLYNK